VWPSQPRVGGTGGLGVKVVGTFAAAREASWGTVALVPTMGYLHEGHLSLIGAARDAADTVVVSNFVNPIQFDEPDDLAAYPRDLGRDNELCRLAGADVVFAPTVAEMYPTNPSTSVVPGAHADGMEGDFRHGHFEGVATVVAKLFAGLQPDRAYFGRKDAQQLAVITAMARDLSFPVEVVPGPTVRESDGLALSSRNVRLADRASAVAISRGLFAAADLAEGGERSAAVLEEAVRETLAAVDLEPDYLVLADAGTMAELGGVTGECVLAAAARVGEVRLIDNVVLVESDGVVVADRGTRLERPSILYG